MRAKPLPTILAIGTLALTMAAPAAAAGHGCERVTVAAGETWSVTSTTRLCALTLADGGTIDAPDGKDVVLVVDGAQTGTAIEETGGTRTVIEPGSWRGDVVLEVVDERDVEWQGLVFPMSQALYVGADGPVAGLSATEALRGRVGGTTAANLRVTSTGENFGGVVVSGGDYTVTAATIRLTGNGRSDFIGSGAGLAVTDGATVVVDHARIDNEGVARVGVWASGGSNLVVKNSTIATHDGVLPDDYRSTVDLASMQAAPWMLGIVGNVRATNLMGDGTQATYIGSRISSTGWGVLSTDTGSNVRLTAINSTLTLTGDDGYGSYAIGDAVEEFLGTTFDVADYVSIVRGGTLHFGDSDPASVAALDDSLGLGLTGLELRRLRERATVLDSDRFGVMFHGAGDVTIDGATRMTTGETAFLDKGQAVDLVVDGSQGASVAAGNGVIFQLMEDDDPGPVMTDDGLLNVGVYTEPTDPATKVDTWDLAAVHDDDAVATFVDTTLVGDFYNAYRGGGGSGMSGPLPDGKNLVLTFDGTDVTGVLSASVSRHPQDTITAEDYELMGVVTNTAQPAVNNGVVVTLSGDSVWRVTGTSYLTSLTVGAAANVLGAGGAPVSMTVDGVATPVVAGATYTGAIVVTVG
ncbi:hypothetical protein OEB99_08330 [Actinotalea sp. M2MS4P-6]|uniref:hypothetical protein n=1 Tax=Actinotalea sp. M2MS4P-6 TaxID=2983762 RepID=UPI0021E3D69D|nr:hypothetical protein [Actinotalea sp. M2MS4P-6]MCV2394313.1 hypothetical protein [Actinotalea sp. M2MS4P-6]